MTTPYDYRTESIPTEYGVLYVGGVLYVHMYSVECIRISVPPDPTSRDHPHHPRPKTQDRRPEVSSYVGSYGVKQAKYRTDRAGHPCTVVHTMYGVVLCTTTRQLSFPPHHAVPLDPAAALHMPRLAPTPCLQPSVSLQCPLSATPRVISTRRHETRSFLTRCVISMHHTAVPPGPPGCIRTGHY